MRLQLTLAAGFLGLMSLSACVDLQEEIVSGVTAQYLETPAGLADAVNASYSGLQDLYAQERNMTMLEYGVDIWAEGADGSHKQWNQYDPRLEPGTAYAREQWETTYRHINTTNAVISRAANIPVAGSFTEAVKNRYIAEARFLRAFYYFYLIRHYGPVHLTLEETVGVETEASRTPVAQIYSTAIIPDLEFAIANLAPTATAGRATQGAAQHLLSLVYLTRNEAGDAARAETLAKAVFNSGRYQLEANYGDLWCSARSGAVPCTPAPENSREVIFTVQFTSDPLTYGNGNRWHLYWGMVYDIEPGMVRTTVYGRPFRRLRPSAYMLDTLFNRSVDNRFDASFNTLWLANNPTSRPAGMALGDTALFMPGVKTAQLAADPTLRAMYCGKRYRIYTEPDNFRAPRTNPLGATCSNLATEYNQNNFPVLIKHWDPTRAATNQEQGQRDFIIFRLAETYLLAAEALIRQGKAAEAVPFVNAVRTRAAKPGQAAAMQATAADMTLDFILAERGRELFGEGHRWFDLVRFGKLVEYVRGRNFEGGPNIKDFHVLRPIPQTQIDRTAGGAESFPQNPGY